MKEKGLFKVLAFILSLQGQLLRLNLSGQVPP